MLILIGLLAGATYLCAVGLVGYRLARFSSFPPDLAYLAALIWPIGLPMLALALLVEHGMDRR